MMCANVCFVYNRLIPSLDYFLASWEKIEEQQNFPKLYAGWIVLK